MVGAVQSFQKPAPCLKLCQSQWMPGMGWQSSVGWPVTRQGCAHGHKQTHKQTWAWMCTHVWRTRTQIEAQGAVAVPSQGVTSQAHCPLALSSRTQNWVKEHRLRAQQGRMCCPGQKILMRWVVKSAWLTGAPASLGGLAAPTHLGAGA